jgi:hypothetical protein
MKPVGIVEHEDERTLARGERRSQTRNRGRPTSTSRDRSALRASRVERLDLVDSRGEVPEENDWSLSRSSIETHAKARLSRAAHCAKSVVFP